MRSPMRVLHVVPSLASRTGGPAVSVVSSALALQRHGIASTIFATDMAEAASSRHRARVGACDLPAGTAELDVRLFRAQTPRRLTFSPDLYRALRDEARLYDVVHIHSLFLFPQFAAYRAAIGAGVPYVVSPRGALDPHLRVRGRLAKAVSDRMWGDGMLARAAALHVTSDEEARLIADVAPGVRRCVVPNGIAWDVYQREVDSAAFRARYLAGADGPLVMYLGRMSHKKNIDLLIRAFALVRRGIPGARLAIVGPDDERLTPKLRAVAQQQGVAGSVAFVGMLQGDAKRAALAAADVWALPSSSENFGNAVVEALAAGRATVVSPGVNISADIAAADAGMVAQLDVEAFADAIRSLIGDEMRRAELGVRARDFARRYDWGIVAPRLIAMYEEVAGGSSRTDAEVRLCA